MIKLSRLLCVILTSGLLLATGLQAAPPLPGGSGSSSAKLFGVDDTTHVKGIVSGVWNTAGSPYVVDSTIVVPLGDTLIIQPGVRVVFMSSPVDTSQYQLQVHGLLQAVGTEQDSIVFTASNSLLGWGGLRFENAHVNSRLEYARIEYGYAKGSYPNSCGGGVYMNGGIQAIKHCSFIKDQAMYDGGAVYLWGGTPEFAYNLFTGNIAGADPDPTHFIHEDGGHGHAIYLGNSPGLVLNHLTVAGNQPDTGYAVYVETGDMLVMRNSILWDTHHLWSAAQGYYFVPGALQYNCIDGVADDTLQIMGEGNIGSKPDENPHFFDLAAGDLRVYNYSRTIDGASPTSPWTNEPMPNGGRANMGAYANGGLAAPTVPLLSFRRDTLDVHYHFFPDSVSIVTDSIEFGLQKVNTTGSKTFTMFNIGRAAVHIDSFALTEPQYTSNFDTLIDPASGDVIINSYDSVNVTISMTPTNVQYVIGTFTPISDDTTFHTAITLHGTGVQPVLAMAPDTVEFGMVARGDSAEVLVKAWNDGINQGGIESKLVLSAGNFSYPGSANFFFVYQDTNQAPIPSHPWYIQDTLAVHDTLKLMLRFKPFGQVDYAKYTMMNSNAGPDSVYCTGSGNSAIYHIDVDSLFYGVVTIGVSDTIYAHIWNTGALDMKIDSVRVEDTGNFGYFYNAADTIHPNDTTAVGLIFHPWIAGPHSTTANIYTSIPNSLPLQVYLDGTGTSQSNFWIGNVGDTTWVKANEPYYVVGNITVPAGKTLTIEPGVHVQFEGNFHMNVEGTLSASGTATDNIFFSTIYADSSYKGLRFKEGSSASVMRYVFLSNGHDAEPGVDGGVLSVENSSPLFEFCEFYNNTTNKPDSVYGAGGAVAVTAAAAPVFRQCKFYNNHSLNGGAFYAGWLSQPVLDSCEFYNNDAVNGGGLYLAGSMGSVHHTNIHNNTATTTGGGVYLGAGATTEMHHNTIWGNTAINGGGEAITFYTRPFLHDETIYGNTATSHGAGLYILDGCSPMIQHTLIAENIGPQALFTEGSTPLISYSTLSAPADTVNGWLLYSGVNDGSLISNTILGSSDWTGNSYAPVAMVGSNMLVTYSDVMDTASATLPGLGNANANPLFVGSGATPQERFTLGAGSPALALSEPDAQGQRGPIGFTGGSSASLTWDITLGMLQNPVALNNLNFMLTSTIPLMAPPYMWLEMDLPDTTGYVPVDSMFMDLNGPGVYIQPFAVNNTNIGYPCHLKISFTNVLGVDTLIQESFTVANLSGTLSIMSLGGDVILSGRSNSGDGVWGIMTETYGSPKPLGSQLQAVTPTYQVSSTSPQLVDGNIEFHLTPELLNGRSAANCAVARWTNGSWQVLPSLVTGDLSSISATLSTGGTYRVVWGQTIGSTVLPTQMELAQNYPNPFNPETTIRFTLPQAGQVKLEVFDIMGRQVVTLLDGQRNAGTHQVIWSGLNAQGSPVASGMYFYRLQMGSKQISKKMVLLR